MSAALASITPSVHHVSIRARAWERSELHVDVTLFLSTQSLAHHRIEFMHGQNCGLLSLEEAATWHLFCLMWTCGCARNCLFRPLVIDVSHVMGEALCNAVRVFERRRQGCVSVTADARNVQPGLCSKEAHQPGSVRSIGLHPPGSS